jgi:hypothetical protein
MGTKWRFERGFGVVDMECVGLVHVDMIPDRHIFMSVLHVDVFVMYAVYIEANMVGDEIKLYLSL